MIIENQFIIPFVKEVKLLMKDKENEYYKDIPKIIILMTLWGKMGLHKTVRRVHIDDFNNDFYNICYELTRYGLTIGICLMKKVDKKNIKIIPTCYGISSHIGVKELPHFPSMIDKIINLEVDKVTKKYFDESPHRYKDFTQNLIKENIFRYNTNRAFQIAINSNLYVTLPKTN